MVGDPAKCPAPFGKRGISAVGCWFTWIMVMPQPVIFREKDGTEWRDYRDLLGMRVGDSIWIGNTSYVFTAEVKDGAPVFEAED